MTEEEYWLWIQNIKGIYRADLERLFAVYPTPKAVFEAGSKKLEEEHLLTPEQGHEMRLAAEQHVWEEVHQKCEEKGIRFYYPTHPDYPQKLRQIPEAPFGLYVKGNLPEEQKPAAGMVGARACSSYGKEMAFQFAKCLAENEVQIISGMAAGIDRAASKGALAAGGKTFVVLGSGVDVVYPIENTDLYYQILSSGGGIISEYPLQTPPLPWQFPFRNRLVSGLCDMLLVMEARKRSGTLVTVRYALEQGRDVYALPGRVTDKSSEGCNLMIADGAGILMTPDLLLETLGKGKKKTSAMEKPKLPQECSAVSKAVWEHLDYDAISFQELMKKCGISAKEMAAALSELELCGMICELSKNYYVIASRS